MNIGRAALSGLLLLTSPAYAQADRYAKVDRCLELISLGKQAEARDLAEEIKSWSMVIATQLQLDARRCLSEAFGTPWIWVSHLSRFQSVAEIEAEKARQKDAAMKSAAEMAEQLKTAQLRASLEKLLAVVHQQWREENESLIETDIARSCTDLHERDRTSAMTNAVCVESFRKSGHPEMPLFQDFLQDTASKALDVLPAAERGVIGSLDGESRRKLCQGRLYIICAALPLPRTANPD